MSNTYEYSLRDYANTEFEYFIPIQQEYKPIHIKWDTGYMDIVPPGIWEIGDTRNCLSKFRKLIRLSVDSDLRYDTNTLSEWRKAIKSELDFEFVVNTTITERFTAAYNSIVDSAVNQDKKRAQKLKRLVKRKNADIKDLEARKKRVVKCSEILEDMISKIKGG